MWRGGWQSSEKRRRRCMSPSALSCGLHSSCRGLPMILFTIFIFRGFLRPKPALIEQTNTQKRGFVKWRMVRRGKNNKMSGKLIVDCERPLLMWRDMLDSNFRSNSACLFFAVNCFCLRPFSEDSAADTEILQDTQTKLDPRYYLGSFQGHSDEANWNIYV